MADLGSRFCYFKSLSQLFSVIKSIAGIWYNSSNFALSSSWGVTSILNRTCLNVKPEAFFHWLTSGVFFSFLDLLRILDRDHPIELLSLSSLVFITTFRFRIPSPELLSLLNQLHTTSSSFSSRSWSCYLIFSKTIILC